MSSDPNISQARLEKGRMDRDPNDLNQHVSIAFDEVVGEPGSVQSGDCVWRNSQWCFNTMSNVTYKVLTFLCAIPFSFCWGMYFACVAFHHVWCYTPLLKVCSFCTGCIHKFLLACLNAVLGPVCEVCGLCFSRIKVTQ